LKSEQLSIMKVIQFPKNRQVEHKIRNQKLDVAIRMLEYLVDIGADFHIVVDVEHGSELFTPKQEWRPDTQHVILSSNKEKVLKLNVNNLNSSYYCLEGNELD